MILLIIKKLLLKKWLIFLETLLKIILLYIKKFKKNNCLKKIHLIINNQDLEKLMIVITF